MFKGIIVENLNRYKHLNTISYVQLVELFRNQQADDSIQFADSFISIIYSLKLKYRLSTILAFLYYF